MATSKIPSTERYDGFPDINHPIMNIDMVFTALQARSGQTAYRLQLNGADGSLALWKTTDGGNNWEQVKQLAP